MTGDLFKRDAEGHLYFVGRKDDMIKSRGEKVAPREVEEVLYAVPGVRDAAVIGVPDELLGSADPRLRVGLRGRGARRAHRSSAPARPSSRTTWSRSASRSATSCRARRAGKIDKLDAQRRGHERLAAATA